ncbi:MAG: 3-methyl-2-oxobutanoate hydroxymethyltransferase [Candidatus Omnitrophota bacterium]|nr:MAG: 3-methyl-2-oxobutanoate hydroxymethyltransferase [Candidatus Omnitrophota bacterium]RKY36808.1 MAG: 3-methyl-2-oxobutanoate hydroxymethyltransferase [Candidatus Omnitrophota bacterium]RKY46460.1 MAG: 3-methyl-2-oxobutanoate hydroxymethyltransferase [Candidatus Omnitrophota bacterium]HDN86211.1 3-methyl-2-oxobutanoate hydroxymethyltransferase [Candidatus Omnitrophota bacterium]
MKKESISTFSNSEKIDKLLKKKGKEKIVMVTCYDYSFASILDQVGLDIILVGDSLANVVLGKEFTKEVSFREMFEHTKAVKKAVQHSLVVADMPYVCYQKAPKKAVYYAKKFIYEAGAEAVKIEWFSNCLQVTSQLIANRIPVMGHIGLTPQTVQKLGGFRVQGKKFHRALSLLKQARELQRIGVFSLVLECLPLQLAELITQSLKIPTIGIGAGPHCDGQVLVLYDLLGLYKKMKAKFVRVYCDLYPLIVKALKDFICDVKGRNFPLAEESFSMSEEEFRKLKDYLAKRR